MERSAEGGNDETEDLEATLLSLSIIGMTPMAAWADCNACYEACFDAYDFDNPNADVEFERCIGASMDSDGRKCMPKTGG